MTNTAEQLEIEEVPSGGIGDFVMSDQDFRVLERQNAEEEYGNEGIARFEDTASRIAAYGRFGDDQVAHVETGELIVPRRLIDQSPELKESIFQHLRAAGIEDPERYVVGDAENSINPETGLMEFGFFSKIFKGIKKAFKKIGKVLKKVAPTLLAIGLAMTPLGAIYGAALGSGIGTLIQGGSLKDALKSGLIAGATAGVFKGIEGAINPNMTAGQAISESLASPGARFAQTGTAFKDAFTGKGGEGFFKTLGREFVNPVPQEIGGASELIDARFQAQADDVLKGQVSPPDGAFDSNLTRGTTTSIEELGQATPIDANIAGTDPRNILSTEQTGSLVPKTSSPVDEVVAEATEAGSRLSADASDISKRYVEALKQGKITPGTSTSPNLVDAVTSVDPLPKGVQLKPSGTAWENVKEMFDFGLGDSQKNFFEAGKDLFFPTTGDLQNFLPKGVTEASATTAQIQAATKAMADAGLAPGFLRRYGPAATGLSLAGAAGGFFEVPPQEEAGLLDRDEDGRLRTGSDYVDEDPFKYRIFPNVPYSSGGLPTYRPPPPVLVPYSMQQRAEGGEIFPRRTGGIMPDEGVPNEDSVKAMLMPGEFVMTTTAVRGAGNGDLKKGINNMYSVMRNLESRGRAAS